MAGMSASTTTRRMRISNSNSNVRFSLPPSIGRVSDFATTSSTSTNSMQPPLPTSSSATRSRSPGWTTTQRRSSSVTRTSTVGSGTPTSSFRRRYSSSTARTGGYDEDILDYRTVRDIDIELDTADRRRSTASQIRQARRNDYTSRPTAVRSRSTSRRRDVLDDDENYGDVITRRRASTRVSSRPARAMSLPRFDISSSSSSSRVFSTGGRYGGSARASSVSRAPSGIYWAGSTTAAAATASSPGTSSGARMVWTNGPSLSSPSGAGVGSRHAAVVINDGWGGLDISSMVLHPGEQFVPTDVSVTTLPSGQKAVTYTRFSQTGHGDQTKANVEIDRVIQRTKRMQETMHTLENFVKRNRSLFPEDIIIYQHIVFYLLDPAELKRLGMRPDQEVYGVKVRERLVAPYGSDVASILRRYYSRYNEVEVEYSEKEDIRRRLRQEMSGTEVIDSEEEERRRRRRRMRTDVEETTEIETTTTARRRQQQQQQLQQLGDEEEEMLRSMRARRDKQDESRPAFTTRLQSKRVPAGEMIRLNCVVDGQPEPSVTWYRNNQPIAESGRFQINNTFGLCTLKILDARKEDAGVYSVRAVNKNGEATNSAEVVVVAVAEELEVSREESTRKPWFLIDVQNTSAQVGQRAVLEAQATGRPPPSFRWQKDGVDVQLNERIRSVSDELGNVRLVVRDVRQSDAGIYFCIAENPTGRAKCAANLHVTTDHGDKSFELNGYDTYRWTPQRPLTPVDDIPVRGGRKPTFVELPPREIEVFEGDPLTLRCTVDGDPRPVVTWYKGVRELAYTERHRILAEADTRYMMQIKSTLQTDPGEYTVVASNSLGYATYTVYVSVRPRPHEELDLTPEKRQEKMHEFEIIKKMKQGRMAPVFIRKLPTEKTLKVGQTLVIKCHIQEAKMEKYAAGVDIIVRDRQPDFLVTSSDDVKAPDKHAGIAVVNGNRGGDVSVTVLKNVVHDVGPPSDDRSGDRQLQNEDTTAPVDKPELVVQSAEGQYDERPPTDDLISPADGGGIDHVTIAIPDIVIHRSPDPEPFSDNDDDDALPSASEPPDETSPAAPEQQDNEVDGGASSRVADDEDEKSAKKSKKRKDGSKSKSKKSKKDLSETSPDEETAPVCLKQLEDQHSTEGGTVTFFCTVSGCPSPDVVWQHNDSAIGQDQSNEENSERLKFDAFESTGTYRLTISNVRPSDVGQYQVHVSNKHGQCSSTAGLHLRAQSKEVSGNAED